MTIELQDLDPQNGVLELNGKIYEFRAFDLKAKIWANYEFKTEENSGLKELSQQIEKMDLIAISKVFYHLLIDKTDFPTEKDFVVTIGNIRDVQTRLFILFSHIVGVSEPVITDNEREREEIAKKARAAGN